MFWLCNHQRDMMGYTCQLFHVMTQLWHFLQSMSLPYIVGAAFFFPHSLSGTLKISLLICSTFIFLDYSLKNPQTQSFPDIFYWNNTRYVICLVIIICQALIWLMVGSPVQFNHFVQLIKHAQWNIITIFTVNSFLIFLYTNKVKLEEELLNCLT